MYSRKSAIIDHIRSKSVNSDEVSSTRVATNSMTLGKSSTGILSIVSKDDFEGRIVANPTWMDGKTRSEISLFRNPQYLNRTKTGTDPSNNDLFDPDKGINHNNISQLDPSNKQLNMVDPNGYQMGIVNSVKIDGNLFLGSPDQNLYQYKTAFLTGIHFRGHRDQRQLTDPSYNKIINVESRLYMDANQRFKICVKHAYPKTTDISGNTVYTGEFDEVSGPTPIALEDTSDDRLKHNEVEIQNARDTLDKLKALMYDKTYNFLPADFKGPLDPVKTPYVREAGFVAQDVEKIPELKHIVTKGSETVPYYLKYTGIVPFLVRASQEMSAELKSMQQTQAALLARIESLESNN